jgi:hypothetical protein
MECHVQRLRQILNFDMCEWAQCRHRCLESTNFSCALVWRLGAVVTTGNYPVWFRGWLGSPTHEFSPGYSPRYAITTHNSQYQQEIFDIFKTHGQCIFLPVFTCKKTSASFSSLYYRLRVHLTGPTTVRLNMGFRRFEANA